MLRKTGLAALIAAATLFAASAGASAATHPHQQWKATVGKGFENFCRIVFLHMPPKA